MTTFTKKQIKSLETTIRFLDEKVERGFNVEGSVWGNIRGNVWGDVWGDVEGDVEGNATPDMPAHLKGTNHDRR